MKFPIIQTEYVDYERPSYLILFRLIFIPFYLFAFCYVNNFSVYAQDSILMSKSNEWFSEKMEATQSIAWGDVDGDGDLDLAVGNEKKDQLYFNENGILQLANWKPDNKEMTTSIAWGDVDGDGDLDLAVGTLGQNLIYINEEGTLQNDADWKSEEEEHTQSVVWGDVNGDGYLDIAVGNGNNEPNRLYFNQKNGRLKEEAEWFSVEKDNTFSLAWVDVDDDGDLDLGVGNGGEEGSGQENRLYINEEGTLGTNAFWSSPESDNTQSIVWGDIDGDRDLDLLVGNLGQPNRLYRNNGNGLETADEEIPSCSEESSKTYSIALGDLDKDGDLDLVVGNDGQNEIFIGEGGKFQEDCAWYSVEEDLTKNVALGDIDGDGDIDLATGNNFVDDEGQSNRIYLNFGTVLNKADTWRSPSTEAAAWGDVNNDGYLDLMIDSGLYINEEGRLNDIPSWLPEDGGDISSIAWGDVDNDGDLDLNLVIDEESRLYLNIQGELQDLPVWTSDSTEKFKVATWGDKNGDGYLDLIIGRDPEQNRGGGDSLSNYLYLNKNGTLQNEAEKLQGYGGPASWGDMDQDGDLDLVTISDRSVELYLNENGNLRPEPDCMSPSITDDGLQPVQDCLSPNTTSSVLGDIDGDGKLDLVIGKRGKSNQIYLNDAIPSDAIWASAETDFTESLALGDVDGDGDLDLMVGNSNQQPHRLYLNHNGRLQPRAVWSSEELSNTTTIALGDVDNDGDLDLFAGNGSDDGINHLYLNMRQERSSGIAISPAIPHTGMANFYAQSKILTNTEIPLTYTLYNATGMRVGSVQAEYSPDGGGKWFPAIAATDTITQGLSATPDGTSYVYTWDTFASKFFGRSDNVVIRMVAYAQPPSASNDNNITYRYTNTTPSLLQQAYASSISYPFRVQGTSILVTQKEDGEPVANTLIYKIKSDSEVGESINDNKAKPFTTDLRGYLQGRGELEKGDRLIALSPWLTTTQYSIYQTNIQPNQTGFENLGEVETTGLQEIVVSEDSPLLLFNFTISLEWDARKDVAYLEQLEQDIMRVSELLYDATNGQAALGKVTIYYARERWNDADLRIYATNRLRPHATIGGINDELFAVKLPITGEYRVYLPGQIHMPATWNRTGNNYGSQGEDWPRTLLHEFGHYFFYLLENYLGVEPSKNLPIEVTSCPGMMGNVYLTENSELHPEEGWNIDCQETLQNQTMEQSDWETVETFYPWLMPPTTNYGDQNQGPSALPLAVTQIDSGDLDTPQRTLDVATYYLINEDKSRYIPSPNARAYLFKRSSKRVIDLGEPRQDRLQVWGAELIYNPLETNDSSETDRICVYDVRDDSPMSSCQNISGEQEQLTMYPQDSSWQPQLDVTAITSNELNIEVSNLSENFTLKAQLYPAGIDDRHASDAITLTTYISQENYTGVFKLINPPFEGSIHIWIDETPDQGPRREAMFDYILNGAPIVRLKSGTRFEIEGDGGSLMLSDGSSIVLNGNYTVFGDNNVVILSEGGSTLILGQGSQLGLSEDNITLTLSNGDSLMLSDGSSLMLSDGSSLMLSDGSSLMLSDGSTSIFGLTLESGASLMLSDGSSLMLSDGSSLMLSDGSSLMLSDGSILEDITLENGNFLTPDDGSIQLELSNSSNFILADGNATLLSSDGQVNIFGQDLQFEPNEFYSIQSLVNLPTEPSWATVVGEASRLSVSSGAPSVDAHTISIRYFERDVPAGEESFLKMYYYDYSAETWTPLVTSIIKEQNLAVANIVDEGVYVLMSSIPVPLNGEGWNSFGYPIQISRTVTNALSHIDGKYDAVYHYDPADTSEQWKRYSSKEVPLYVNNLEKLEHNKVYWVYISETLSETDLQIKGSTAPSNLSARSDRGTGQLPPSTFYGQVTGNNSFAPIEGMAVIATIDGVECGRSVIQRITSSPNTEILPEKLFLPLIISGANTNFDQTLFYVIDVNSAGSDHPECGRKDDIITFSIESEPLLSVKWDNSKLQELNLGTPTSILDAETAPEPPVNQNH